MEKVKIGIVTKYFPKVNAAVIELTEEGLKVGETVMIQGYTTDLQQKVESMQIEKNQIEEARKGEIIGLEVSKRVRPNDIVYKVIEE
jgi:putative protease